MFELLRKAERLTNRYCTQGKRHNHLMQLKRHYRIIREYQVTLQREKWQDFCQDLGHESGLSRLWGVFRTMNGRAKVRVPILDEMCLQMDYSQVEDTIIHTLFPHAVTDPSTLPPLPIISIDQPVPELDSPLSLGELQVAISNSNRPYKAPSRTGHSIM